MPKLPRSSGDLLAYTRQLEPWINDHFGFRTSLIKLNNRLRHAFFNQFPTIQVISGRQGRIFLSSHATTLAEYSAITIPCGYTPTSSDKVARQLNSLHESFAHEGIDARIMIVPSSPIIYAEELPGWLEKRCGSVSSPIESMLASPQLEADTRKAIYFPKAEMIRLKETIPVFPKTWFHWAGAGPRDVAGSSVEFFWNIPRQAGQPIAERVVRAPSDISHLFPGIELASEIDYPDHAKSLIDACLGPQCFPSIGAAANKLQEVAFYRNPSAPEQRLIILSDSFGQFIASWYPRYFKEVIHFSTNALDQLDAKETAQFKAFIKSQAEAAHVMVLYHDGSVLWDRPAQDQENLFTKHPRSTIPSKVDGT